MITLSFRVDGLPKGQPRVKAARRGGFVSIYTPGTAKDWKRAVHQAAVTAEAKVTCPSPVFTGPVELILRFWMPRPKSHLNSKGSTKSNAPRWHTAKPDFDNLAKAVCDVLTDNPKKKHKGIWRDDAQIVFSTITKEYGSNPGCEITIRQVEP